METPDVPPLPPLPRERRPKVLLRAPSPRKPSGLAGLEQPTEMFTAVLGLAVSYVFQILMGAHIVVSREVMAGTAGLVGITPVVVTQYVRWRRSLAGPSS